jgi:hypothetical protein
VRFLGVEFLGQRGGTDEIGEQHRHRLAFAGLAPPGSDVLVVGFVAGSGDRRSVAPVGRAEIADSLEDADPVAGGFDADIFQRLLIDISEQLPVDVVGFESIGVLSEAEALQPF